MSATAAQLFEQTSPLTEALNIQQSKDRSQSRRSCADSEESLASSVRSLRKALQFTRMVREKLTVLPIETNSDREAIRESAIDYGRMARNFHDLHAELIEDGLPRTHEASIALEEIAVELEDIAESMALAGSRRFADLVEREIAAYVPARKLDAQT